MAKFDVLYPNTKDDIEFEGSAFYNCDVPGKCWHCGSETGWINLAFEAYLCSEECDRAKWGEYSEDSRKLVKYFEKEKYMLMKGFLEDIERVIPDIQNFQKNRISELLEELSKKLEEIGY